MDIRHLHYFMEVANQLNFTKAASALHISQPALSKTIKQIETKLNVTLFNRSAKQLELTDAGDALRSNAKEVLHAHQNLMSELTDVIDVKKGKIHIGIPPIIGAAYCSKIISHFIEHYPTIDITLREVGTKTITTEVQDGTLDIGFICNIPHKNGHFNVRRILNDPLMVIVQKNHPLAHEQSIRFRQIEKEPFIMYREDFSLYDSILKECSTHNFYPKIVCESSQKDFMIEMVEAKLGIGLLPKKICEKMKGHDIIAIPFERPSVHLELGVIWGKDKYLPFTVREFLTVLDDLI